MKKRGLEEAYNNENKKKEEVARGGGRGKGAGDEQRPHSSLKKQ